MSWKRRRALSAALLAAVLAGSGCATVPQETQPQAIGRDNAEQFEEAPESEPEPGLLPTDVVRQFVRANAEPVNKNQAARLYVDPRDREKWSPESGLVILEESYSAIAPTVSERPVNENEIEIKLKGQQVGRLGSDNAFTPARGEYPVSFRLRRQRDGQWRILNPPSELITTKSEFMDSYQRVTLYYFARSSGDIPVPDPRYVPSNPHPGMASRVISLLLNGPSVALKNAVDDPLQRVTLYKNVTTTPDGALAVPLTGVSDDLAVRSRIATQIVMSLRGVTSSRVRISVDDAQLLQDRQDWYELPSYEPLVSPGHDLPGMMLVDGRLRSLGSGAPVQGPSGAGRYQLVSAAQSIQGGQLALVEQAGKRMRLRVGGISTEAPAVDLRATTLTRPTWRPGGGGNNLSTEVWTVKDGDEVVRVVNTPGGVWKPQRVNTDDLGRLQGITALRLSRDGTRAAIIAKGKVIIASVVRSPEAVLLSGEKELQPEVLLDDVVDVDWLSQDLVVVATSSSARPVVKVGIDGFRMDSYNRSNLTPPIQAVAAAPGRSVIAADDGGLWTVSGVGPVWRPHVHSTGVTALPFYPG